MRVRQFYTNSMMKSDLTLLIIFLLTQYGETSVDFFNVIENTISFFSQNLVGESIQNYVKFYCIQPNQTEFTEVFMRDPELASKLNTSLPLAFFIHGYMTYYNDGYQNLVAEAYVKYIDSNFCMVDWKNLATMEYSMSVSNTEFVGNYTGDFIADLVASKYFHLPKIKIIGVSLGAHIAGIAGTRLNGEVGHIIGLDPAGPLFTKLSERPEAVRLNSQCAGYVQVLHTDITYYGTQIRMGDADFYANGGIAEQPGCPFEETEPFRMLSCSHIRVQKIFRASLNPDNKLIGYKCDSYENYLQSLCLNNTQNIFGVYSEKLVEGSFYFQTTDTFPYTFQ